MLIYLPENRVILRHAPQDIQLRLPLRPLFSSTKRGILLVCLLFRLVGGIVVVGVILQTENETFIDGLEELAREKHKSVTGWEDVVAGIATLLLGAYAKPNDSRNHNHYHGMRVGGREGRENGFQSKTKSIHEKPNDRARKTNEMKQKKIDNQVA